MMAYMLVLLVVWIIAIHAFTLLPKYSLHKRCLSSSIDAMKNGIQMVIEKRAKADELPITLSGKPLAVQALKLYKDLNVPSHQETWSVPQKFVVPSGNYSWPESVWGMKLGGIAKNIKRGRNHKSDRTTLEYFGMDLSSKGRERAAWDRTYAALKRYKDLYVPSSSENKWTVPQTFVVQHFTTSWPQALWGMKIGTIARNIKRVDYYKSHRAELEGLGFDFTVHRHSGWDQTYAALKLYKDLNVPTHQVKWTIPIKFVVPHNVTSWPEAMWGMKLGIISSNIKLRDSYKSHRAELEDLGFDYTVTAIRRSGWDQTYAALQIYKDLYVPIVNQGNWTIPTRFVVPLNNMSWPQSMWGMKLGDTAENIRRGYVYTSHRSELEKLGFDYSSRRQKRKSSWYPINETHSIQGDREEGSLTAQ